MIEGMRSLSDAFADFAMRRMRVGPSSERAFYGFLEAWTSIIINSTLAAVKLHFGLALNSIALLADSAHTASDIATSVVVLAGFKSAQAPPDDKHPFGHGRIETVAGLAIAVLLVVTGLEFASSSVKRLVNHSPAAWSLPAVAMLAASGVLKEWLARFSERLGKKARSAALVADAWHHRSDAIASIVVAVSLVAAPRGLTWVDGGAGLAVSALIAWTGVRLVIDSGSTLVGEKPDPALIERIERAADVDGVRSIHKISVHDYGQRKVASLHMQVDGDLSVSSAHALAGAIKHAIARDVGLDTVIHIEPAEIEGGKKGNNGKHM